MPKSEFPKTKRPKKASEKLSPPHFPSKPYMRTIRGQSPTSVPTAAWSTTDDELLLRSKSLGKKWVEISPLFPGKTSNACRKRHARLVTHAQVEWDELKERDLAVQFVNAKVGFFKVIAENLKLEWRQVEKKCLELGFKTLLEKGRRLPAPLTLDFEQTWIDETSRDGLAQRALPKLLEIKLGSPSPPSMSITPGIKMPPYLKSLDSDKGLPQFKPPRYKKKSKTAKLKLVVKEWGLEGDTLRGGDEIDEGLDFEVPLKGECMNWESKI